jgi:hypothetical protein
VDAGRVSRLARHLPTCPVTGMTAHDDGLRQLRRSLGHDCRGSRLGTLSPMTHPHETLVRDAYGRSTKVTSTGSLLPSLRMLSSTAQMVRLREGMQSGRWSSSYAL